MKKKSQILFLLEVTKSWLHIFNDFDGMLKGTLSTIMLTIHRHVEEGSFAGVTFERFIGAYIAAYIRLKIRSKNDTKSVKAFARILRELVYRSRRRDINPNEKKLGNLENVRYCDAGLTLKSYRLSANAFKLVSTRAKFADTLLDFIVYYLAKFKLVGDFLKYVERKDFEL